MSIPVKLEAFEGPLDLLLHLIEKNKVNIYDIPIVEITNQYLGHIKDMQEKDLDIMSEFLVMAATLIYIKSRMLLPKDETKEEEEVDPRQELVDRLLEYKLYKYISYELKDKELDAAKMLFKEMTIPSEISDFKEEVDTKALLSDLTLGKLHKIFQSMLKKQEDKIDPIRSKFGRIEREDINLSDKITEIQTYGLLHKRFSFRTLLTNLFSGNRQHGKVEMIVTFLGILELIKIGQIVIEQEELFEDIQVSFVGETIIDLDEGALALG